MNIDIDKLMTEAKAAFDSLSPDEQIHHRHEQRISFVVGNLAAMSSSTTPFSLEKIREYVMKAAGPCPCAKCRADFPSATVIR